MLWRSYLFHTGHLCCASVSCVLLNDLMQTNIGGVCLCCSIFCFVHHCWSFSSLFFSPLCCLFLDLRLLITPFDIFKHFAIVLSVLLRFTASDYPLWYFQTFRHCVVCSSIYGFWLPPLVSSSSPQYKSMSIRLFWQHRENSTLQCIWLFLMFSLPD